MSKTFSQIRMFQLKASAHELQTLHRAASNWTHSLLTYVRGCQSFTYNLTTCAGKITRETQKNFARPLSCVTRMTCRFSWWLKSLFLLILCFVLDTLYLDGADNTVIYNEGWSPWAEVKLENNIKWRHPFSKCIQRSKSFTRASYSLVPHP